MIGDQWSAIPRKQDAAYLYQSGDAAVALEVSTSPWMNPNGLGAGERECQLKNKFIKNHSALPTKMRGQALIVIEISL